MGGRFLFWIVALIVLCCATLGTIGEAQDNSAERSSRNSPSAAESVTAGKVIYEQTCSGCHGPDASGGFGPDIRGIPERLGDDRVVDIIRHGIPGTGMAGFPLTQPDALEVVAYLRTLGKASSSVAIPGNPATGEKIFEKENCRNCHITDGNGGDAGPELTRIGSIRAPAYLRQALLAPGAELPKEGAEGAYRGRWTQYLMFRAVTKTGSVIEGMRVGEDSFGIVLKDANGDFHSLHKSDLRSLTKEPGKSFMPSYEAALEPEELDDLVAYLSSLKSTR